MNRMFFRRFVAVLTMCGFWHGACAAQTQGLKVEDIVRLESFGRASISPDETFAVYERREGYNQTPRYDTGGRSWWAINDLWLIDLRRPTEKPQRLLPSEPLGLLRGPWSPSGRRLVVYRFRADRYEIGIADPAQRSVVWTGLTPEFPQTGAGVEWISDRRVALTVRLDGSLPFLLNHYGGSQTATTEAWAHTREGRLPSRTVIEAQGGVARAETPEPDLALVALDVLTASHQTLVAGRVADFSISPDGRWLAALRAAEPAPVRPDVIVQADGAWRQRLAILDLSGDEPVRSVGGFDIAPHLLRWSEDSGALLVWGRHDGAAWSDGDLLRVDRAGGVTLLNRDGLDLGPPAEILRGVRADWLSAQPVVYARSEGTDRSDWHAVSAGARPRVLTSDLEVVPGLWSMIDRSIGYLLVGGRLQPVSDEGPGVVDASIAGVRAASVIDGDLVTRFRINATPRRSWSAAFGSDGQSLVLGGGFGSERLGPGADPGTRLLAASRHFALVTERTGVSDRLRLRTADLDQPVDAVNADFSDTEAAVGRPIAHADAWGRPTVSYLFMPPGVEPGSLKGVIVQVYPGGADSGVWSDPFQLTYGLRPQVLAAGGYAVLSPSIPLEQEGAGAWPALLKSVDIAVDAVSAAEPDLPSDRMVILGHSFGGYAALALATQPSRYRGFVASSGVSDMFGQWGELTAPTGILPQEGFMLTLQQGWVEEGQGGLRTPPWVDPSAYVAQSPFLSADRITRPVLLLTADKDYIPMSQSERMFSALWRLGGDVKMVTYWGEHHARWSPANMLDQYAQVFAFVDRVLSDPATPTASAEAASPRPAPIPRTQR